MPIIAFSPAKMTDMVLAYPEGSKLQILAPVVKHEKGWHKDVIENIKKQDLHVSVSVENSFLLKKSKNLIKIKDTTSISLSIAYLSVMISVLAWQKISILLSITGMVMSFSIRKMAKNLFLATIRARYVVFLCQNLNHVYSLSMLHKVLVQHAMV